MDKLGLADAAAGNRARNTFYGDYVTSCLSGGPCPCLNRALVGAIDLRFRLGGGDSPAPALGRSSPPPWRVVAISPPPPQGRGQSPPPRALLAAHPPPPPSSSPQLLPQPQPQAHGGSASHSALSWLTGGQSSRSDDNLYPSGYIMGGGHGMDYIPTAYRSRWAVGGSTNVVVGAMFLHQTRSKLTTPGSEEDCSRRVLTGLGRVCRAPSEPDLSPFGVDASFAPTSTLYNPAANISDYYDTSPGSTEVSEFGLPYGFFHYPIQGYPDGFPVFIPVQSDMSHAMVRLPPLHGSEGPLLPSEGVFLCLLHFSAGGVCCLVRKR